MFRSARVLLVFAAFLCFITGPALAAGFLTQKPCDPGAGFCKFISPASAIPTIRKIAFKAPGKGKANVSFNGSLVCETDGAAPRIVDFASQITDVGNATADPAGPGGLRHTTQFDVNQQTATMNLASSRLFNISGAGKNKFFFRLTALQFDTNTSCYIYNAVFTVDFKP
jgi:hypothetical protein